MSNKKYINVNIAGTQLDLPSEGVNLELTYVNPCAEGFATISGNKSERSQTFPATKQNDSVFENWWNVSQQNTPSAAEEKDAFIEVDGLPIMSGKAQLKGVTTQGLRYERQGKNYSVSFIGDNADWFERLKDKQLGRDLDWSAVNHDYTEPIIKSGYNQPPSNFYAYCVARLKDSTYQDTVIFPGYFFDIYDSTPVLYIGEIIKRIFNSIGYTLSSGFWANFVNERYVLPVPLNAKYPQEFSEDYLNVKAIKTVTQAATTNLAEGIPFDSQTKTPPLAIPNPLVLSAASTIGTGLSAQYTAPYAGFYQLNSSLTVDNISGSVSFNFGWIGLGIGLFPSGAGFALTAADNGKKYNKSIVVEMQAGETIEFAYALGPLGATLDITAGTLEIVGEAKIEPGSLIDFKYLLRDWKITDFIKGVTAAFNLCWQTNVGLKIVTCEPKDSYIVTNRALSTSTLIQGFHTNNTNDYQQKLDYKKEGKVTALNSISEIQLYKWAEDGADATAEYLNDNEFTPFDGGRYNMPLNRFKANTEENENPFFAPTVMYYDESIRGLNSTLTPLIPLLWPDNFKENPTAEENETQFLPRILWFGGQRGSGGDDGTFQSVDSTTGSVISDFLLPACFFVNYNDSTGFDVSLNWSTLTVNGNTIQGQLQRFYLNELARMRVGKEMEEWIYWDELDIMSLDFGPKIFINGDLFILKKIDSYSPLTDRTTKTILLYDVPISQEDVNRIENTLAIGFISDYTNPDE